MLAAAWRLTGQILEEIADELGDQDSRIREKLQKDTEFRNLYLELRDHVGKLVEAAQSQFALLATTARKLHLAQVIGHPNTLLSTLARVLLETKGRARIYFRLEHWQSCA